MKLKELLDLIQIRQYIANSVAIPSLDKPSVNDMARLLPKIDKKIVNILQTDEFKNYISPFLKEDK